MEQIEFECRKFTNTISQFVDSANQTENWIQHAIIETKEELNPNEYKKCVEYDFFQKCMQQRKIQWNIDEKKDSFFKINMNVNAFTFHIFTLMLDQEKIENLKDICRDCSLLNLLETVEVETKLSMKEINKFLGLEGIA